MKKEKVVCAAIGCAYRGRHQYSVLVTIRSWRNSNTATPINWITPLSEKGLRENMVTEDRDIVLCGHHNNMLNKRGGISVK